MSTLNFLPFLKKYQGCLNVKRKHYYYDKGAARVFLCIAYFQLQPTKSQSSIWLEFLSVQVYGMFCPVLVGFGALLTHTGSTAHRNSVACLSNTFNKIRYFYV